MQYKNVNNVLSPNYCSWVLAQALSSFYTPPAHLLFSVKWHFEWLALLQMESTAAHRLKTEKPLVEALKTL
jgi:hypothetical protein